MDNELLTPWYSLSWFEPSIMRSYSWENPLFLWAILLVPLLFILRWTVRYYFNQKCFWIFFPKRTQTRMARASSIVRMMMTSQILKS